MLFTVVMIRPRFNTFRSESPEGGTAKLRNLCHPERAPLAPPLGNRRQCKLLSSRRLISAANGSETAIEEIMGVGDRLRAQTNRTGLRGLQRRKGFGWQRWSRQWLYDELGLYNHYRVRRPESVLKANPAG